MATQNFCSLLKESLADENKAPKDYARLNNSVYGSIDKDKGLKTKNVIDVIISDEKRHFEMLNKINKENC